MVSPDEVKSYSGDEKLDEQISNWLKWDQHEETRKEIQNFVNEQKWDVLKCRLLKRISFGTAGLRAEMRAGFDSMNPLVVIQAAQGLAEYIFDKFLNGKQAKDYGIVFGYDGRHNSKLYAKLSANVFQLKGFKVYLFGTMVATPFVPFAVLKTKSLAGVMVTASHNPKDDNGYKVYWSNGAQIISPHDKAIHQSILNNLQPKPQVWDTKLLDKNPLIVDPFEEITDLYYQELVANLPRAYLKSNEAGNIRFVYTALHGVGYKFVQKAFEVAKLAPPVAVDEQKDPDPDFPTVKFPNPEEGKCALERSLALAKKEQISIILANDPDADRLACAEKQKDGEWKIFNGNELGALLGWWAIQTYKLLQPNFQPADCYLIASTVSSKMLASIAAIEGMNFEDTLTGFKWMCNKALELTAAGKTVLFAFEESIGYMFFMNVLDKDGVSAATHLATMATYLQNDRDITLSEKLEELYETYGYHCTEGSYFRCEEPETIKKIFNRLRSWDQGASNTYPKSLLDGKYQVDDIRDLTTGLDTRMEDKKATLPVSSSSQMITFYFANKVVLTLRTSGTEPKIKYYAEICGKPGDKDVKAIRKTFSEMVDAVLDEFLQPGLNNLARKSD